MNKKKIAIGIGAVILAVTVVFASTSKATYTYTAGVYYKTVFGRCLLLTSHIFFHFNTTGTIQARIITSFGATESLWASSSCNVLGGAAYFKGD
jgi:hypothetical protein